MYCEECGAQNQRDARFCEECGHPLPKTFAFPRLVIPAIRRRTVLLAVFPILTLALLFMIRNAATSFSFASFSAPTTVSVSLVISATAQANTPILPTPAPTNTTLPTIAPTNTPQPTNIRPWPTNTPLPTQPSPLSTQTPTLATVSVQVNAHVQAHKEGEPGWIGWITNPNSDLHFAGTVGENRRLEAFQIRLVNAPPGMQICYQAHVQAKLEGDQWTETEGWKEEVCEGGIAGTIGQERQMEAAKIHLLNTTSDYHVCYRAYVTDMGWMQEVCDGQVAGTVGQEKRMEALQVRLTNVLPTPEPTATEAPPTDTPAPPTDTPVPLPTWTPRSLPTWTPAPPPPTETRVSVVAIPYVPSITPIPLPQCRTDVGCPLDGTKNVDTAYQPFQHGFMLWRGDTRLIYVIYNDGMWQSFVDTWNEGEPQHSCTNQNTPAQTPPTPHSGFGKVWCTQSGVRNRIGNALAEENGNVRPIQDFQTGVILG